MILSKMSGPLPELHSELRMSISPPLAIQTALRKTSLSQLTTGGRKHLQYRLDLGGPMWISINTFVSHNVTQSKRTVMLLNYLNLRDNYYAHKSSEEY